MLELLVEMQEKHQVVANQNMKAYFHSYLSQHKIKTLVKIIIARVSNKRILKQKTNHRIILHGSENQTITENED